MSELPNKADYEKQGNSDMAKTFRRKKPVLRSGLEDKVKADLEKKGITFGYETIKLNYTKDCCPACGIVTRRGTYTPDFIIERSNGIRLVVESKGYFPSTERTKMQNVKRDNPTLDIRILFQRDNPIRKGSKTLYTGWAGKNGFISAVGERIPEEWLK